MNGKDIELFLKAKKEKIASNIFTLLAILPMATIVVLEALSIEHDYTILLVTWAMIFLASSYGSRWVTVSKEHLLGIIQRQIDNDPEAIQFIAESKTKHGT